MYGGAPKTSRPTWRGGRDLAAGVARELVATHGSPLFVYRPEVVEARVGALRAALGELPLTLRYAVKANPCPALLQALRRDADRGLDGLDVASAGELRAGIQAGFGGDSIALAGPGKSADEHRAALDAGAAISVESLLELERLLGLVGKRDGKRPKPRLRLRVNPREMIHAYGLRTGGGASPFGIDEELLPQAAAMLATSDGGKSVEFEGIHVHAGSQCFSAAALARSFTQTLAIARRFEQRAGLRCRVVNLGGGLGHGSWYGANAIDLDDLGARLRRRWAEHLGALGEAAPPLPLERERRLELEPGRWLVGPAGSYLCRVLDVKVSRGQRFVVVDGGMHQLFAATGVYGPTPARPPLLRTLGDETDGRELERCAVVGRLCTPLDRLAADVQLPEPRVGDLLCFDEVGAYGPSASPERFLSHPGATEVVI